MTNFSEIKIRLRHINGYTHQRIPVKNLANNRSIVGYLLLITISEFNKMSKITKGFRQSLKNDQPGRKSKDGG